MITGRLFTQDSKEAVVCEWTLQGSELVLTPAKQPDGRRWSMPMSSSQLSLGGFNEDQVVLKHDGLTFYAERAAIEPPLRRLGYLRLNQALGSERQRVRRGSARSWAVLALLFVAVGLGALFGWYLSDRIVEQAARVTPVAWDVELGTAVWSAQGLAHEEVTDADVTQPVQKMVDLLTVPYADQGFRFHVHVIKDDNTVNAFALPGGQMAVYTGLLKKADGPEEVMGVLAHEVQHVVERHGLRSVYGSLRWQLALFLIAGDASSLHGQLLNSATFFAGLSYGRDMEREADRKGVALLQARGYGGAGMVKFFKKLDEQQGGLEGSMKYLSTHPTSKERIENLERMLQGSAPGGKIPVDWDSLQRALGKDEAVESRGRE
jgi:beta-barrel assembly-enhancing protease